MSKVYLLWHEYEIEPDGDETKLCGVYASREHAEAARQRLVTQPGFRDHPDDFEIAEYQVDRDYWTEGFITVD